MSDRLSVTISGGVADVRLNRPDKMNALDDAMFEALIATGERLKAELSSSRRTSAPSAKDAGTQLSAIWRAMPIKPAALTTAMTTFRRRQASTAVTTTVGSIHTQ